MAQGGFRPRVTDVMGAMRRVEEALVPDHEPQVPHRPARSGREAAMVADPDTNRQTALLACHRALWSGRQPTAATQERLCYRPAERPGSQ